MLAYHVGIDLHKTVAQVCVLDAEGEVLHERRWRLGTEPEREALLSWLEGFGPQGQFAVEALGCNRWFVLACQARGYEILVVDPTQLDLKRTGKKTDRRDAREIARRLHLGDLARHALSYFPTEAEYADRKLLRTRHRLAQTRTALIAQIRGILNAYAIRPPADTLYTKPALAWLRRLELGEAALKLALDGLVDSLEAIHRNVVRLTARSRDAVRSREDLTAMQKELPGAGEQTVFTLVAELGEASRFGRARQAAAYGGAVSRIHQSADRAHHGRITKRGNRELRFILGQWAVRLMARDDRVKQWAQPMLRRMHKNKVRTALARRLLVGVWVMLKRGEVFSLEACLGSRA